MPSRNDGLANYGSSKTTFHCGFKTVLHRIPDTMTSDCHFLKWLAENQPKSVVPAGERLPLTATTSAPSVELVVATAPPMSHVINPVASFPWED